MSKALTKSSAKTAAAAPFGSIQAIDPKQLEATIEKMYFQGKNVTPEQKLIFTHAINRTGLDPIVGQIRPVLREDKKNNSWSMAIQTSIDGYRLIASRTGEHAGTEDAVYGDAVEDEYQEKEWYTREDNSRATRTITKILERPVSASVTVYRLVSGTRCAFTASARWGEYYPGLGNQGFMWRKMPFLMLAKCAEALALRKAFPADLSGIYTDDEMQQASKEEEKPTPIEVKPEPEKCTADQLTEIDSLCKETKTDMGKLYAHFKVTGVPTKLEAEKMIASLKLKLGKQVDAITAEATGEKKVETPVTPEPKKEPTEAEIAAAERAGMATS